MKIGFFADAHVANHRRFGGATKSGINARARHVLDVLQLAVDRAKALNINVLVGLGDFFDTVRPEPQIIAEAQSILSDFETIIMLVGNHEQVSDAEGDHAIGPLWHIARVVEQPQIVRSGAGHDRVDLICVPFISGNASDWMPPLLDGMLAKQNERGASAESPVVPWRLLALHCGISDDATPPWLVGAHDSIPAKLLNELCEKHNIAAVFAGNWHNRKQWKGTGQPGNLPRLFQVGALVPTGFDNPGLEGYGTLAWCELGMKLTIKYEELAGPRFIKVDGAVELARVLEENKKLHNALFISETAMPDDLGERGAALDVLKGLGAIAEHSVIPDATVTKAQARTAATTARSAITLQEALDAFVREMPLPLEVDRKAVLEKAKEFLP